MNKELEAQGNIAAKIKAMESKLLSGGEEILAQINVQQRLLDAKAAELAEQKVGGV
jgi:hypothetical protein